MGRLGDVMTIKEYKKIIKKIYSDFKKKYPEEYKRQMDIKQKSDEDFFNRLKLERKNNVS